MRQLFLSICLILFSLTLLPAQSGCPGCQVNLPANLPADTLYLPPLPDAEKGVPYDEDISFRVPKTTTPVNAVDSTTPPGLTISKIEIVSVEGMPPGLFWQANQTVFNTATETDGCIKICGTPTKSDSFVLTVNLKATVLIFTQEASFPMYLYVSPKTSSTVGFSMVNVTGCGSTTVTFTNNIPSGGEDGFTYEWDFGDSTTYSGENPPPHTYTKPGKYVVNYEATIDTAGYRLVSATVLGVSCSDLFNAPDLYVLIFDAGSNQIFNSSPEVTNTSLPYTFPIGLQLDPQSNYTLEVWDEDSGLDGSDDLCGSIPINILSADTIVSGSFKVVLNIDHPVDTVRSTDTVTVFPVPMKPLITANDLTACLGSNNIVLESSFGSGNHWWRDGEPIAGADDFLYMPAESGYYQVQVNNQYGCSSISDSVFVDIYDLPAVPAYVNDRNNLELLDTLALPANYSLQWFLFAGPIAGATGFTHCATVDGEYSLVVTDLSTGCTNTFATNVVVDPNYDCTLGANSAVTGTLRLFPNPATDWVTLQLAEPLPDEGRLQMWDVFGRQVQTSVVAAGTDRATFFLGDFPPGAYVLELFSAEQRLVGRLLLHR